MYCDFLKEVFAQNRDATAICWRDASYSYAWLLERVSKWEEALGERGVRDGEIVALDGDFTPDTIAMFIALVECGCIVVPHNIANTRERANRYEIAGVERWFAFNASEALTEGVVSPKRGERHVLYDLLCERHHPGLVLFTSGSSGSPKAAVHDFVGLLEKFKVRRRALKTINFLLFDHWGGLNTMLHTLSNAGAVIPVHDRNPDSVCAMIERHGIELLPASPTFLNLMMLSKCYSRYNLESLTTITYGTEPMPLSTLTRLREVFPQVRLHQTYGLIEVGVLRSKSRDDNSLWVKVGGDGYETRVVEGVLEIKAKSAMLGYLNAPSPFSEDGWFITGDAVETDGEYLKILGRRSEMINVGGDKVSPSEIESVIQEIDNVAEVTVYGEKHPIVGNIVCARVRLISPEDTKSFTKRLRDFCSQRLQRFKVPMKVDVVTNELYTDRFKKRRMQ